MKHFHLLENLEPANLKQQQKGCEARGSKMIYEATEK